MSRNKAWRSRPRSKRETWKGKQNGNEHIQPRQQLHVHPRITARLSSEKTSLIRRDTKHNRTGMKVSREILLLVLTTKGGFFRFCRKPPSSLTCGGQYVDFRLRAEPTSSCRVASSWNHLRFLSLSCELAVTASCYFIFQSFVLFRLFSCKYLDDSAFKIFYFTLFRHVGPVIIKKIKQTFFKLICAKPARKLRYLLQSVPTCCQVEVHLVTVRVDFVKSVF